MVQEALQTMCTLNQKAAESMIKISVQGCTDITGFGLIGHAVEMALASKVTLRFYAQQIPILPGAKELAAMGLIPAGTYHNKSYCENRVQQHHLSPETLALLYDPQTSGGLLIAVSPEKQNLLLEELKQHKVPAAIIGFAKEVGTMPVEIL